ncbi:MAG TPA: hypothetical protein VLM85_23785 [Polyangiaceae bacterium]|nr:hypothetical protein [Polyangiaceae bacterium]
MITLLFWALWASFIAAVMFVDHSLRSARGEGGFNSSPITYMVLSFLTPFLVLPVYFYSTRRNGSSGHRALVALAGVPITVLCWMISVYQLGIGLIALSTIA